MRSLHYSYICEIFHNYQASSYQPGQTPGREERQKIDKGESGMPAHVVGYNVGNFLTHKILGLKTLGGF